MITRRGSFTGFRTSSASGDYKSLSRDCKGLVLEITQALKEHEKRQSEDVNDYGYVGDLGHIKAELAEALRFLKGQG